MTLRGRDQEELTNALRLAFTYDSMKQLLAFRLDRQIEDIALGRSLKDVAFALVSQAEREGWTQQLIAAAREVVPGNARLHAFSEAYGLASTSASGSAEQVIIQSNIFHDVALWRSKLGDLEPRVCRISFPVPEGTSVGTGFLVGPDLVLTNFHVVERIRGARSAGEADISPEQVSVVFDYKRILNQDVANPGVQYGLGDPWLIVGSPVSDADRDPTGTSVPPSDELDYAVVRLAKRAGDEPVGGSSAAGAPPRGWIAFPQETPSLLPETALLILQHPKGEPLKLTFATNAIVGLNANQTRVTYRTNTEPGSSGSPCFDQDWRLVALHHWGDPAYDWMRPPRFNRGVPISAIQADLNRPGQPALAGQIGAPSEPKANGREA